VSIFVNRTHLFVWSVFAPKFLYLCGELLVLAALCACSRPPAQRRS
jgi:hypothetical protein